MNVVLTTIRVVSGFVYNRLELQFQREGPGPEQKCRGRSVRHVQKRRHGLAARWKVPRRKLIVIEILGCTLTPEYSQALRSTGLRRNDPRLQEMNDNLRRVHKASGYEGGSPETQKLNREIFKEYVSHTPKYDRLLLFHDIFQGDFAKHRVDLEGFSTPVRHS